MELAVRFYTQGSGHEVLQSLSAQMGRVEYSAISVATGIVWVGSGQTVAIFGNNNVGGAVRVLVTEVYGAVTSRHDTTVLVCIAHALASPALRPHWWSCYWVGPQVYRTATPHNVARVCLSGGRSLASASRNRCSMEF
mgnify:CR=1 FL=1